MSIDDRNALAGPSNIDHKSEHARSPRRIFIGPMPYIPERDIAKEEQISDFAAMHGLRIFLQQGGRIEEWTEARAREYKQRLKERITESTAWYTRARAARKRMKVLFQTEWRGDTFEIGKLAGVSVNMLAEYDDEGLSPRIEDPYTTPGKSTDTMAVHWDESTKPSSHSAASRSKSNLGRPPPRPLVTNGSSSFFTARTHFSTSAMTVPVSISPETSDGEEANGASETSRSRLLESASNIPDHVDHDSSETGQREDGVKRTRLKSILRGSGKAKGKRKVVLSEPVKSGNGSPVPPEDVLERPLDAVPNTSAAESVEAKAVDAPGGTDNGSTSDIVMRDKMLVRVFRSEHESLKTPFTESECRVARGVYEREWGEFMIIWRKHRIELYEEYLLPCKELLTGHKHLAFVIPLKAGTRLSIFSPVDMSFCLICPPTSTKIKNGKRSRWPLHLSKSGLNIFILRPKSRSRAVDWIWSLWKELGNSLPGLVEIICPLVGTRVKIRIPDTEEDAWKAFTRDYIVDQCERAMKHSFTWKTVTQLPISTGRKLELAWRTDSIFDWVWLRNNVEGQRRDWEVLYGLALQQLGNATSLELHLAEHYPSEVVSKNGTHTEEPPAIEGYMYRTRKRTRRIHVYLSSHDSLLCSLSVENAIMPPTPTDVSTFSKEDSEILRDERRRLRSQLVHTRSFWDLRDVLVVRRASHPASDTSQRNSSILSDFEEGMTDATDTRRPDSDIEDEGGDEGTTKAASRGRLKRYRSFEVVLKTGKVLRFETHSSKHSVEWVTHLRALVSYWKERHRNDVLLEMNIIKTSTEDDRITVTHRYDKKGRKIAHNFIDKQMTSEYMNEYWNWCVLDGCRPIVRSGRLYTKNKLRGRYILSHLILTSGWLVQFHVSDHSLRKQHTKNFDLLDTYVCSGYYAALTLQEGEYDPNAPPIAKYFQDGLETKDAAEDTLFLIWYRPHTKHASRAKDKQDLNKIPLQKLNARHEILICRARNKLERDAWCWALNSQMEKVVRAVKEREKRAREQGMPVS